MLVEAWGENGSLVAEASYADFSIGTDSFREE